MMNPIPIPLASGKIGWISAGPTRDLPDDKYLVACAAEIPVDETRIAYDLKTKDFSTFPWKKLAAGIPEILEDLEAGDDTLYVGCMGGTGRTGTILAMLVASHPDMHGQEAVQYIRHVYKHGAVETTEQADQVGQWSVFCKEPPTEVVHSRARGWFSRLWDTLTGG